MFRLRKKKENTESTLNAPESKPEPKPERIPMAITSTVKEVNGYIEIIIVTCLDGPVMDDRDTIIKKDQIACIDLFYEQFIPNDYHHIVMIGLHYDAAKIYYFERKEDAKQLYNAVAKLLKKKEVKNVQRKAS